jgi:hypothetical protein
VKRWLLKLVIYLGPLNFVAFIVIDFCIGGDALSGKSENGHFYLGNHGTFTEVSHAVFVYSVCHAYSALFGLVLAAVAAKTWKRRQVQPPLE